MLSFVPLLTLPLIASPLVYFSGRKLPRFAGVDQRLSLLALLACWGLFPLLAQALISQGALDLVWGAVHLRVDGLSLWMILLALLVATLVVMFSGADLRAAEDSEKYYSLILISLAGVIGLVCAADLFNLWVWFELLAVTSYLLVGFYREQPRALGASIKYLIQTATGSGLVVFGIALVLLQAGTLDLTAIHLAESPLAMLAGALFCIGFGVKIAIVPTYTWLPDAYAHAPSAVSALLSGIVTITGLVALLRVLAALAAMTSSWAAFLLLFGSVNIVLGNILALSQREVKRILAYSSISQTGYVLLAFGIGLYAGQAAGIEAGLLHLMTHGVSKVLAFLALGALIYLLHLDSRVTLDDLAGTARRYPLLALALTVAALSLAGVPAFAGFMSKWQIFAAGLALEQPLMLALVIFAALNSVLSLAYYLPLVNTLFRPAERHADMRLPMTMRLPILCLSAAVLLLGLWPTLYTGLIQAAAAAVLAGFGG